MRGCFIHIAIFTVAAMVLSISPLSAQLLPERRHVQFRRRNFYNSLNRYNEALEYAPLCYEALYNRANAYLHKMLANPQDSTLNSVTSNRYFEQIANNKSLSPEQRAEVLRNIGESLFLQEEYEAALNAFRESLKLDPDDQETKRNYVLTKRIVDQKRNQEQQQQQEDQQDNDKEQDDDKKNNDQQPEGGDGNDQNDDQQQPQEQPQEQPENGDNPEQNEQPEGGEQPNEEGATPEQERMLDIIQGEEDKTQDKLKDAKQGAAIYGKKNW